jgi:MFS family permease
MYGIFFAIVDGVQRAFVVDLAPTELKGTALGTFHTSVGLVALPGGFLAGFLWDAFGPGATFLYGFALGGLALLIFTRVKNNKMRKAR